MRRMAACSQASQSSARAALHVAMQAAICCMLMHALNWHLGVMHDYHPPPSSIRRMKACSTTSSCSNHSMLSAQSCMLFLRSVALCIATMPTCSTAGTEAWTRWRHLHSCCVGCCSVSCCLAPLCKGQSHVGSHTARLPLQAVLSLLRCILRLGLCVQNRLRAPPATCAGACYGAEEHLMEHSMSFRCQHTSAQSTSRHGHAISLCTAAQAAGHTRASS